MALWFAARFASGTIAAGLLIGLFVAAFPDLRFVFPSVTSGALRDIPLATVLALAPSIVWVIGRDRSLLRDDRLGQRSLQVALLDVALLGAAMVACAAPAAATMQWATLASLMSASLAFSGLTLLASAHPHATTPKVVAPVYLLVCLIAAFQGFEPDPAPWAWPLLEAPSPLAIIASAVLFVFGGSLFALRQNR